MGAAFTTAVDGDTRGDASSRHRVASVLGLPHDWATVRQVHGAGVVTVDGPGEAGAADALFSQTPGLPLAVFTADCVGVVIEGPGAVGVAHAGWRGAEAGVVGALLDRFTEAGIDPDRATIGPHIRSCCFEVGPEVAEAFPDHVERTTWGTTSVDLAGAIRADLDGLPTADLGGCTMCGPDAFSHRRDSDQRRMAAIGWLQGDRP